MTSKITLDVCCKHHTHIVRGVALDFEGIRTVRKLGVLKAPQTRGVWEMPFPTTSAEIFHKQMR